MENNTIETTIAEAVKAKVQVMVVEALGDPGALVRSLVAEALTAKVENKNYPYNKQTVINKIVREAIIGEAKKAMAEWIDEQRPAIKAELKRQLVGAKEDIAERLIQSVMEVAQSNYMIRVVFEQKKD